MHREKPLTSLVTGATAAMIALTGCVLYLADTGLVRAENRFWPIIVASSAATLLVMSLLHSDLQRLYELLANREAQAREEARIDQLTGLANRTSLSERIEIERRCLGERSVVLCLLDLDHFKRVNDTRGHEGGDELLVSTARRLQEAMPGAFVARLGGDEFAVVAGADGNEGAEQVCRRIVDVFSRPFTLSHGECFTRGSLGAAFLEPDLSTSDLLRRADKAMYQAKSSPHSFRIFDEEMIEDIARRSQLAHDLRHSAPDFENCSTVYQPIMAAGGALMGLEALLRWKHPRLGPIPPEETVSLAEEIHFINQLGLRVAADACRAAQAFPGLTIACNVSVVQLLDARFDEDLGSLVAQHGLDCGRLQLEIREVDFATRGQDVSSTLRRLKCAGFRLAVDDFGSSTSSMAQLQKLGVSVLKLDPKVLRNAREVESIAVMRAKVELAKALGMSVVCEGVAVEEDRSAAIQAGCDMLQGFLLGRPEELGLLQGRNWVPKAA